MVIYFWGRTSRAKSNVRLQLTPVCSKWKRMMEMQKRFSSEWIMITEKWLGFTTTADLLQASVRNHRRGTCKQKVNGRW